MTRTEHIIDGRHNQQRDQMIAAEMEVTGSQVYVWWEMCLFLNKKLFQLYIFIVMDH